MNDEALKVEESAFKNQENLEKKVSKYGQAKSRSNSVSEWILNSEKLLFLERTAKKKLIERAYSLKKCAGWLVFRNFYTVDKVKLQGGFFCHKPMLCGVCAIFRSARTIKAYEEKFNQVLKDREDLKTIFISTTVRNGEDLLERFNHLRDCKSKMVNRRRKTMNNQRAVDTSFNNIRGSVWSYEVTNIGNGWHPHDHMIALVDKNLNVSKFKNSYREEWKELTADSFEIDVQEIIGKECMMESLIETFKYSLKMNEMTIPDQVEAFEKLEHKRMIESCGVLRGVKIDNNLDDEIENEKILSYVDMVYRYISNQGYKFFESVERKEAEKRMAESQAERAEIYYNMIKKNT